MLRFVLWIGCAIVAVAAAFVITGIIVSLPWWGIFSGLFVIGIVAFWIFTVVDIWRRADLSMVGAVLWTAAAIIFPILGPMVYFFSRPRSDQIRYRGETIA